MCRLLLYSVLLSACATAQRVDMLQVGDEYAQFAEARALAADPQGRLYVVDTGRNVVVQLAPDGRVLATIGGPGTLEGAFYDPQDIDPTNGLVLVVADAGNSRIQRLSNRFLPLESLPVARIEAQAPGQNTQPVYHMGDYGGVEEADGRPIAVVTSAANETFAIDASQGLVLKWNDRRRLERTIGSFEAGEGALQEPIALAIDDIHLYVADRGTAGIAVYDHLGGFVRWIDNVTDVRALSMRGDQLWIVQPRRLLVYSRQGRFLDSRDADLGEPLVDALPLVDRLLLLTAKRLVAVEY